MRKNDKKKRQDAISEILNHATIDNQEELLKRLSEKGFEVTQATLSRDFREMKISKTPDATGCYIYRLPGMLLPASKPEKYGMMAPFFRQGALNIEFSGQLAVIKTPGGYAHGIARDIEANTIPGIMTSIAGYDSILVVLRENANRTDIIHALKILFSQK